MLKVAEENAKQAGLTNVTFREADAHALPFPDQTFDRVTCRFGVYYFADVGQALREIRRVLRPDGLVALIAMGPLERNPFMLVLLEPFLKRVEVPAPLPGAPHPFKFAERWSLARELEKAGFEEVAEQFQMITWAWPGPPDELFQCLREISAPFHPIMDSLAPDQRQQANSEVVAGYGRYYDGQFVNAPGCVVVASGAR